MKKTKRILSAALAAVLLATAAAGCQKSEQGAANGKTVIVGAATDLKTLDTGYMYEVYGNMVSYSLYDMLFRIEGEDMSNPKPSLVTDKWTLDETGTIYTLPIREGVKFSSGNPLTALRMLEGFVSLTPGDWVVQNASNSGVGRCIIQLAREMGVKTVNFVRRPDELRDELTALGADLVVGEDDEDVVKNTLARLDGKRPVLASNAVGGESALRLMDMLAPGGSMVTYGAMSRKSIKVPNGFLIFKGIKLEGLWVTQWLKNAPVPEIEAAYDKLARLMADGRLKQAVDTVYPLSDVRRAVEKAQEEFRSGKVVLSMERA